MPASATPTNRRPEAGDEARPLRVAYLINQYPKISHAFIRREIKALEARGVEVERFSVRRSPEALVDEEDVAEAARTRVMLDGVGIPRLLEASLKTAAERPTAFARALLAALRIARHSDRGLLRNLAYLAEACVLLGWLEESRCAHLHAHFGTNPAAVAMLMRRLGGPSYSFTVHGPEEFDRPGALHLGEKIRGAAFVAGVSSFGRSQLYRQVDHRHWDKVEVVRCGVDRSFLERPPKSIPKSPRLVCVGRLCEQKGQLLLVQAAARLAEEGVPFELVLVGDGELRSPIEAMIEGAGLRGSVRITGWADAETVQREIEGSRALVLPSFAEGLPVVLMEALALGRPVLSTYVAGIPELVEDGVNGMLIPAGSIDALAEGMRRLLEADAESLAAMGEAGRRKVRGLHDADRSAEALERALRRAVEER